MDCERSAIVLEVAPGRLRLRFDLDPACAGCTGAGQCLLPSQQARELVLAHDLASDRVAPVVGQRVVLAVTPGQRLTAAWWLWLMPTLALLGGAGLAERVEALAWLGAARAPLIGLLAMSLALLVAAGFERRRRGRPWGRLTIAHD